MILKHLQGTYQSPRVRLYVHLARIFGEYCHKYIMQFAYRIIIVEFMC
jgi:hypothetical protein